MTVREQGQSLPAGGLVQVVAVAGGKGGVGKTQTVLNLAVQLAARGQQVLVLEGNLAVPGVDAACGLQPCCPLERVLAGDCMLEDALQEGPQGVRLLTGNALNAMGTPTSVLQVAGLIQAFDHLSVPVDVLLIDCGSLLEEGQLLLMRAASEILLVSSDEPGSDAATLALVRLLQARFGISRFRLLGTMTASEQGGSALHERLLRLTESLQGISLDHVGSIPFDETLRRAAHRQKVVSEMFPRARSSLAYKVLAEKVAGWPLPANPRGHLEFFAERLIGQCSRPHGLRR